MTLHLVPNISFGRASYSEALPTAYAALIISTIITAFAWTNWISQAHASKSIFPDALYEIHWIMRPVVTLSVAMKDKIQF